MYDTPDSHVTRDYKEGLGRLGDLLFKVLDTSGLEPQRPQHTIQVCPRAMLSVSCVMTQPRLMLLQHTLVCMRVNIHIQDEQL